MKDSTKAALVCVFWTIAMVTCLSIGDWVGFISLIFITLIMIGFVYYDYKVEKRHLADRKSIKMFEEQLNKQAEEINRLRVQLKKAKSQGFLKWEEDI